MRRHHSYGKCHGSSMLGFCRSKSTWHFSRYLTASSSGAVARAVLRQQHASLGKVATSHVSTATFVSSLQLSLVSKSPWMHAPPARSFGTASQTLQSRKPDSRVADEVEEEDDDEEEEDAADDDDDDYAEDADEEEEEEYEETSSEVLSKKKFQIRQIKIKSPELQGRVLNEKITARTIRLVIDGEGHGIVSRAEALAQAKKRNLDLVQVDNKANPPVCKIFDFNKEEYRQEQVQKDRKKQKGDKIRLSEVKELRFNPKTESKDLKMKADRAREFMGRGHRVKLVVNFKNIKGKTEEEEQQNRVEQGKLIDVIIPMLEDIAAVEQGARIETTKAWVLLRPSRFGGKTKKKQPKTDAQPDATIEVMASKQEDIFTEPDESKVEGELLNMESFQGYSSQVGGSQKQLSTVRSPSAEGKSPFAQNPTISSPVQPRPPLPLSSRTPPFVARRSQLVPPSSNGPSQSASSASQGTGKGYCQGTGPPPNSDLFDILTSQELKPPPPRRPPLWGSANVKASAIPGLPPHSPIDGGKKQGPEVGPSPILQSTKGIQVSAERSGTSLATGPFIPPTPTLHGPNLSTTSPVPQGHGSFPHSSHSPPNAQGSYRPSMPGYEGPSSDQSPFLDLFSSTIGSHQGVTSSAKGVPLPISSSNNESPLLDLLPSTSRPHPHGLSSVKGVRPQILPAQNSRGGQSLSPPRDERSSNESLFLDLFPSSPPQQPRGPSVAKGGLRPPISPVQNAQRGNSPSPPGHEGYSNDESPLLDLFPSTSLPQPRGPSNAQGMRPPISPGQNAQGRYRPPLPGLEVWPPRGPPRYAPPPIGQPRYPSPQRNPHEPFSWDSQPAQQQGFMQGPYRHSPNQSKFAPGPDSQFSPPPPNISGTQQGQGQHGQPPSLFGLPPHTHQGLSEPSQVHQFRYQGAPGPVGPRERSPWLLPRQGSPRSSRPIRPPHPECAGDPPMQNNQGYFVQQEAFGFAGDQNQAPQDYPPQQPGGYSYTFEGNGQSLPRGPAQPRGFPQARPPPSPEYQPSGSAPHSQSQPRHPPWFNSSSEDS